jgi:hypothetical protein
MKTVKPFLINNQSTILLKPIADHVGLLRSGSNHAHLGMEQILQAVETGRVTAEFLPDGTVRLAGKTTTGTHPSFSSSDTFTPSTLPTKEGIAAYDEARKKVSDVLNIIKEHEEIPIQKLQTTWKSGLVLGGIGGGIVIIALTLKLLLESMKDDDPETYNKLTKYQWPALLATDVLGLLFFKKAYHAWHRPFLKPIEGNYDIHRYLAENGLVIPELITLLKQCNALLTETQAPDKRFSPEVYQLIKEKAVWAERFLHFLVEPRTKNSPSAKLNLKSDNYALLNLTKEEAIKKLNIKNLLPKEAKKEIPWYEQLIGVLEFPIDWTVGLLTGERLATVQEVQALYSQAWENRLLTGKNEQVNRYFSQINAEIETRATSDYTRGLTPSKKQVEAMVTGNFPQRILAKPTDGQVLSEQANNPMHTTIPLGDPSKEDVYVIPLKLNLISLLFRSVFRAFLLPTPNKN